MARQWLSLSKKHPKLGAAATSELAHAYKEVFTGSPSQEQQQIVLADLRRYCGVDMITPPDRSDAHLRHAEGKRDVGLYIQTFLNMREIDLDALREAAQREAVAFGDDQGNN